ncbi:hypothetical protein [Streptomyces sp. NPDC001292]|uniref:hypothetical protein n=1 Tax=Streptomyces sp. NPDC001292 TaxID=3364558 RepID=UPI0036AF4A9B
MSHPADLVTAFDRDEELAVSPSLLAARSGLEATDVADGPRAARRGPRRPGNPFRHGRAPRS